MLKIIPHTYWLVSLLGFFSLWSCDKPKVTDKTIQKEKDKNTQNLIELVEEQLALKSPDNKTFLDFEFGMDATAAKSHADSLVNHKKIELYSIQYTPEGDLIPNSYKYLYNLQLEEQSSQVCTLLLAYHQEKLHELTLEIVDYDRELRMNKLLNYFTDIYGEPSFTEPFAELEAIPEELAALKKVILANTDTNKYYWLNGNKGMKLLQENLNRFQAVFFDLPTFKTIQEAQIIEDRIKKKDDQKRMEEKRADFK